LLITSGILRRRGNELFINNGALQELTERLHPDMPIHITRARILNRNARNNFLAINEPIYRNPSLQLCYNHEIRRNGLQTVGLNDIIIIIHQICNEGISKENHHPDEVEIGQAEQLQEEEEQEENNQVANILLNLGDVHEPVLLDEEAQEEEQIQEQHQEEEEDEVEIENEVEIEEGLDKEVTDNEEAVQHLINYATNLPVDATAQAGHHERCNQPGLVELNERKQFTSEAKALTSLYATYLMGWSEEKTKQEKLSIAEAASTMVAYDLGYKKKSRKNMGYKNG